MLSLKMENGPHTKGTGSLWKLGQPSPSTGTASALQPHVSGFCPSPRARKLALLEPPAAQLVTWTAVGSPLM